MSELHYCSDILKRENPMELIKTKTTNGFDRIEFSDLIGNCCSIQIESNEKNLWFGVDIDSQNLNSSRMLLNREQIKELLPILQKFADNSHRLFIQNDKINRNCKTI